MENLLGLLLALPALIVGIVIHEYSHGRVAELMGDPSARRAGRLTLNPLPHLDPFGSVILPLFLIISGSPVLFAAAKPVPVNPHNFRHGRRDFFWVGLAGPVSNLAIALTAGLLTAAVWRLAPSWVLVVGAQFVRINIILAVFNLIPVPPLDGSRLVEAYLPESLLRGYMSIEPFGIFIIFGFIFFFNDAFWAVLGPIMRFLTTLFMPGVMG